MINFTVTTTVTMNARPHTINAVGDIFVLKQKLTEIPDFKQ